MSSVLQPVRIGIIGAGGIVKTRHMPGLRAIPGVSITRVCNRSTASAEAFCHEFAPEARVVADWGDVCAAHDVDAVWIGAHPYLHADATCLALANGKHVFTQARMAASLDEAQLMWEASMRFPEFVTAICPAPHGMKGGELVKKLLAEGAIGTPHQALLHSFSDSWLDPATPAHWRQQSDLSGIQILTLGIFVEVLQKWLGHIVEVEARGNVVFPQRGDQTVEIPDFVNILAKFRNGIEATLLFSGVAAHAPTDKLWIFGSEGTLSYDFVTDEIHLGKRGGKIEAVPVPAELQRTWTVERDFIAAIRDPQAPRPTPSFVEGLCYMRVVDGVWQAMDSRAAVKVA
ncbi:MAG: Gfo/Idh/MocA family oxidoreductase [Verrucomicrobiaceae bacterium]|nr:Gfo/Idh/MocA family oxidoreductase [Verrucomicrobiaceae bacterium]